MFSLPALSSFLLNGFVKSLNRIIKRNRKNIRQSIRRVGIGLAVRICVHLFTSLLSFAQKNVTTQCIARNRLVHIVFIHVLCFCILRSTAQEMLDERDWFLRRNEICITGNNTNNPDPLNK